MDGVKLIKVLILYCGGTIGMQRNKQGVYVPFGLDAFIKVIRKQIHDEKIEEDYGLDRIESNEILLKPDNFDSVILCRIVQNSTLLDSSNMCPNDWINIAKQIDKYYSEFDGFVVLHGTDTLAYTASALSFMFEDLQKPVILTGSQIPIFETRSDAKDNLLSSIILAGYYHIPEVCIQFARKLLRGNRTVKISSEKLNAFDSPNYHILAYSDIKIKLYKEFIVKKPTDMKMRVHLNLNPNVGILYICPTITSATLKANLKSPIEGLVILSYGAGNFPTQQKDLMDIFRNAIQEENLIIVNVSQCNHGSVIASYETGQDLENIGIIPGGAMTCEAAYTKLCYVLGLTDLTYEQKVQHMKRNLRGELNGNTINNL